jgi:hypothetical protein
MRDAQRVDRAAFARCPKTGASPLTISTEQMRATLWTHILSLKERIEVRVSETQKSDGSAVVT